MGYVIERTSASGTARYTAMYRDIRGSLKSAGTFAADHQAARAWQRAEDDVAAGRIGDPRRGKQTLRHYIESEWLPRHVIEASTRQSYAYLLDRYILPDPGDMKLAPLPPGAVRRFVLRLQKVPQDNPPTIRCCKVIPDAVFPTAMNDQIIALHPGRGVKTPPIAKK